MSTLTRSNCHEIARDLLISARHEPKADTKRALLRLCRTWINLALLARRDGPIRFRARVL